MDYRFKNRNEVNFDNGLWVLFAFGAASVMVLMLNMAATSDKKLKQLAGELLDEGSSDGIFKPMMTKAD